MKSILAYAPILAILLLTIGCNAENPICTDNFCAIGEVFPRSELDTANFSEVDIDDSVIFATLVGVPTPVETTPVKPVFTDDANGVQTFADIISDVETNGVNSTYKGKTVTVTAFVVWKQGTNTALSISEDGDFRDGVVFFVTSYQDASKLKNYEVGQLYTFTLFVRDIQESTNGDDINIWSNFPDAN